MKYLFSRSTLALIGVAVLAVGTTLLAYRFSQWWGSPILWVSVGWVMSGFYHAVVEQRRERAWQEFQDVSKTANRSA